MIPAGGGPGSKRKLKNGDNPDELQVFPKELSGFPRFNAGAACSILKVAGTKLPAGIDVELVKQRSRHREVIKMEGILSNHAIMKPALIVVGVAGIRKVAAAGRWADPLSIVAYLLGAAAIGILVAGVAGWELALITTEWEGLVAVVFIIAVKIGITAIHALPAIT